MEGNKFAYHILQMAYSVFLSVICLPVWMNMKTLVLLLLSLAGKVSQKFYISMFYKVFYVLSYNILQSEYYDNGFQSSYSST